ncbi:MAG: SET domain-containing protein [Desulfobulbaceae bacterium]|nr:SET domain-containing protein [Desulfobulbaceae bacterium]HIJ78554.1 SET domain-containing protein [Deltaproteobacteria bacterium]
MLIVKTYLDRSTIHGIGIFAGEQIACDAPIWEFNPAVDLEFTVEQWLAMKKTISPQSFNNLLRSSYKENNRIYLCMDNAQFMNHSTEIANIRQDEIRNTMHAKRTIQCGEELLCDYFAYSDPDDLHLKSLNS